MTKNQPYNELPLDDLTKDHIEKYGYSGSILRLLRIKNSVHRDILCRRLKISRYTLNKLESSDKIGIKHAKLLSKFYNLSDWRILRKNPSEA